MKHRYTSETGSNTYSTYSVTGYKYIADTVPGGILENSILCLYLFSACPKSRDLETVTVCQLPTIHEKALQLGRERVSLPPGGYHLPCLLFFSMNYYCRLLSFSLFMVLCFSFPVMGKGSIAVIDVDKKSAEVEAVLSRLTPSTSLDDLAAMRQEVERIASEVRERIVELEEGISRLDLATHRQSEVESGNSSAQSISNPEIQRSKEKKEADLAAYTLLALICKEKLALLDNARKRRVAHKLIYRGDDGITLVRRMAANLLDEDVEKGRRFFLQEQWKDGLKKDDFAKVAPDYFLLLPAMFMLFLVVFRKVVCRLVERYGEKGNLLCYFDLFLLGRGIGPNFLLALAASFAVGSWLYLQNDLVSLLLCWGAFSLFYLLAAPFAFQAVYYRLAYSKISVDRIDEKNKARFFRALFYLLCAMLLLHFDKLLFCFLQQDIFYLSRLLFLAFTLFAVWRVTYVLRREYLTSPVGSLLVRAVLLVSLVLFVVEAAGYHNLTEYLLTGISKTVIVLALLLFFSDLIDLVMCVVAKVSGAVFGRLAREEDEEAAAPPDKALRLLNFTLKLLLYFVFFCLLIAVWGAVTQPGIFFQVFTRGTQLGGFSFYPARLIMAVVLLLAGFAIMSYLRRLAQQFWLHDSEISRNSRETVLTLASYLGYALLILVALSVAGLKLTGLSIVLGAFSVGIGFGLQNVVNNFISGLILMFEQPVRLGDWVRVGDEQGYVKQISIRSTVIQTFDKEDVIVPNSELISAKVTNITRDNTLGRLKIPIGVAYGTDPRLVEKLLLEIARANPRVINNSSRFRPRVFFLEFGDSSLNFSLYCYLRDINSSTSARSEINFEIERLFREHAVDIPFPQREVTVRNRDNVTSHRGCTSVLLSGSDV
ncbi:MAG: hypothetical protein CSA32_03650 [Desulfobulbus propionicus]|nr:MAG: hypothetical protein CSA32_03650 [Desulfobulbus propionicus]